MKCPKKLSATIALILNIFLFIIKMIGGILSGSLALISDAINSLSDILATISVLICVNISNQKADEKHPYGHTRAEPIGGIIVSIVAIILGVEIFKEAIKSLIKGSEVSINILATTIILITIISKLIAYIYFRNQYKKTKSPSINALKIDSINDVWVSSLVVLSFILIHFGFTIADSIIGLIISIIIIRNGFLIGTENIDFLMGSKPDEKTLNMIKQTLKKIKEIKSVNKVKAHYVGTIIHVEISLSIDENKTLKEAHKISHIIQEKIESIEDIDKAFIHISPISKPKKNLKK